MGIAATEPPSGKLEASVTKAEGLLQGPSWRPWIGWRGRWGS